MTTDRTTILSKRNLEKYERALWHLKNNKPFKFYLRPGAKDPFWLLKAVVADSGCIVDAVQCQDGVDPDVLLAYLVTPVPGRQQPGLGLVNQLPQTREEHAARLLIDYLYSQP